MDLIFICSPYAGDIERNITKAQGYCRFAYSKGTVPYAPHLHNPQFLDEKISEERTAGIKLGIEMLNKADELWCFGVNITAGMQAELRYALENDIFIKYFNEKCEEVHHE